MAPRSEEEGDDEDEDNDSNTSPSNTQQRKQSKTKTLICQCPTCSESFDTIRRLYGHFGAAHARYGWKLDKSDIGYACPFCPANEEEGEDGGNGGYEFQPLEEMLAHVQTSHPGCQLNMKEYPSSPSRSNSAVASPVVDSSCEGMSSLPLCKCPKCDKIHTVRGLYGVSVVRVLSCPAFL